MTKVLPLSERQNVRTEPEARSDHAGNDRKACGRAALQAARLLGSDSPDGYGSSDRYYSYYVMKGRTPDAERLQAFVRSVRLAAAFDHDRYLADHTICGEIDAADLVELGECSPADRRAWAAMLASRLAAIHGDGSG